MSMLEKDIKGREYIFCEEKNMREYSCSNLWIKEKVLSFNKYEGAVVEIFNNEVTEYLLLHQSLEDLKDLQISLNI